jgi:hypothetical protein
MKSIYQLTTEALEIASLLEENELTPEIEQVLVINQDELKEKALNYAYVIRTFEDDVTSIDNEIKRLRSLKEAKTNSIERLKESISTAMNIYGIEKVESPLLKLSFRKSEAVEITNEEVLPLSFKTEKVTYTPNKTKIKEAIKNGETVFGAILQINYNLQIK